MKKLFVYADLHNLLDASEEYMLSSKTAKEIIKEVINTIQNWQIHAKRLDISKRETALFAPLFAHRSQL